MASDYHALFDSDAFIGLFVETDAHHQRISEIWDTFQADLKRPVTTNFVVVEVATWLSRKADQQTARAFIDYIRDTAFPVIYIDKELQHQAINLFYEQSTKRISLVDCANVVVMRLFEIPTIFSFDKFYQRCGLDMVR